MAEEHEIIDVGEMHPDPKTPCWYVTTRTPSGEILQHIFPKTTMEWRAAEYGLTDPEEILDIILHEPHQPRAATSQQVSLVHPAPKSAPPERPATLWTAESTRAARTAHRTAIAAVKQRLRLVDPAGHLAHIVRGHGMTAAGVRAKAERADTARWQALYGGLPVPVSDALEVPRA